MHKQLASYLGVNANNISVWIWGNPVRLAGLLPNRHVRKICDLYGIKAWWLEVESIEEFKALLDLDTLARLDLTTIAGRRPCKNIRVTRGKVGAADYTVQSTRRSTS